MNKEFLDFVYEQKAKVSNEIEAMVRVLKNNKELSKADVGINVKCVETELRIRRSQLLGINQIISKYLQLNSKSWQQEINQKAIELN